MNLHKAKDIFMNYIREKGLRNTQQREVILDEFLSADRHITVDELFNLIKEKNPEIVKEYSRTRLLQIFSGF